MMPEMEDRPECKVSERWYSVMDWRNDKLSEYFMGGGVGLNVWWKDLCVIAEINKKGITCPALFDLDHFEGTIVK